MKEIDTISNATQRKKQEATAVITNTYLNPDEATKQVVANIQNSVDEVFNNASAGVTGAPNARPMAVVATPQTHADALRRHGGHFSKHMEALTTLDDEVKNMLMNMMGALSNDDVIGQRLEHIVQGVHALKAGLSYLLVDFSTRFNPGGVATFRNDLLDTTWKQYTMEEERDLFRKHFGDPAKAKKKAS